MRKIQQFADNLDEIAFDHPYDSLRSEYACVAFIDPGSVCHSVAITFCPQEDGIYVWLVMTEGKRTAQGAYRARCSRTCRTHPVAIEPTE
jgi:hypothetical protein